MEQQEINHLIEKYLAGTATAEEKETLMTWYRSEDIQEVEWHADNPGEIAALRDRVLANLRTHIESTRKKTPVLHSRWFRTAAAAAIILALSLAIYLGTTQGTRSVEGTTPKTSTSTNLIQDDRMPGGNNAVLTLSDGSVITLDTLRNGVIAANGNARFNKVKDGQLTYLQDRPNHETAITYNTLSTRRGGQYMLTLPDGSRVWLNASSSLNFPSAFSGRERKVTLTGEAYFEVARNENKPFLVVVNDMQVEVLGTHFNINGYDNEALLRTTLLEGKVKVGSVTGSGEQAVLLPGQQAQFRRTGILSVLNNVNLQEAVAWKEGMFVFDNTDINSIMRQLERWYDVEVDYAGLPSKQFNGMISRNVNLSEVLKMMEVTSNIRFKIENRKISMAN